MSPSESALRGLLSVREAAAELALRPATIRAWLLRRKISCVRLSARCVRIPRAEVERLIRENTVPAREVGQRPRGSLSQDSNRSRKQRKGGRPDARRMMTATPL